VKYKMTDAVVCVYTHEKFNISVKWLYKPDFYYERHPSDHKQRKSTLTISARYRSTMTRFNLLDVHLHTFNFILYTYSKTHKIIFTHTHTHPHTHVCTHTHAHTHTSTHTHTQTYFQWIHCMQKMLIDAQQCLALQGASNPQIAIISCIWKRIDNFKEKYNKVLAVRANINLRNAIMISKTIKM
jgi:hypothetical protein